jgi:hypothetical protein
MIGLASCAGSREALTVTTPAAAAPTTSYSPEILSALGDCLYSAEGFMNKLGTPQETISLMNFMLERCRIVRDWGEDRTISSSEQALAQIVERWVGSVSMYSMAMADVTAPELELRFRAFLEQIAAITS